MVEDLVAAAINDARAKADAAAAAEMQKMTSSDAAAARIQAAFLSRLRRRRFCGMMRLLRGGADEPLGAMQDLPLRIMRLIDHAEREHGTARDRRRARRRTTIRTNWKRSRMTRGGSRRRSSDWASGPVSGSRRWP